MNPVPYLIHFLTCEVRGIKPAISWIVVRYADHSTNEVYKHYKQSQTNVLNDQLHYKIQIHTLLTQSHIPVILLLTPLPIKPLSPEKTTKLTVNSIGTVKH